MVKIRLARRGRKRYARYDVVIADSRAPRDGKFIEKIGVYNPNTNPATVEILEDRAMHWLMNGAQPTDTVRNMLSYRGILFKKHLQVGVNKGALTQEQADERFEVWRSKKEEQINAKIANLSTKAADELKARMEAERKIRDARAEVLQKKKDEEESAIAEAKRAKEEAQKAEEEAQKEAAEQIKQEEGGEEAPAE